MGYISTNCQRIVDSPWSKNIASRYKSKFRLIKSANVFLTRNGVAKLGDMNVSKVVRKDAMC